MLTVLSVAYPLAPVRPEASGGAEQVLAMLDEALTAAGHRSIVVASEGSVVAGTLVPTPKAAGWLDTVGPAAWERHRAAIADALARWPVDVIHMHGQDFREYLPPAGIPVLATLHVPREWYGPEPFRIFRPGTYLNCVSETQRRQWPDDPPILETIENGVRIDRYQLQERRRSFALALGRISPEKGFHLALTACEVAGVTLVLAGGVYRYREHERYFREQIRPRLRRARARHLGAVGPERKRRLLAAARCVLIPSQAPETSSLVAMEALASGTPVIAYPAGALASIVEHAVTGYLVSSPVEMAMAIRAAGDIDPEACREAARRRFDAGDTIARYFKLYARLAGQRARAAS